MTGVFGKSELTEYWADASNPWSSEIINRMFGLELSETGIASVEPVVGSVVPPVVAPVVASVVVPVVASFVGPVVSSGVFPLSLLHPVANTRTRLNNPTLSILFISTFFLNEYRSYKV